MLKSAFFRGMSSIAASFSRSRMPWQDGWRCASAQGLDAAQPTKVMSEPEGFRQN